jgi:hypothetical protein
MTLVRIAQEWQMCVKNEGEAAHLRRHPERSETKSKDPQAFPLRFDHGIPRSEPDSRFRSG